MKKILFFCDGNNFSNGAFEFIKFMNRFERVCVKGLFFSRIDYEKLVAVGYAPVLEPYFEMEEEERQAVRKGVDRFVQLCQLCHIDYEVHDEEQEWDKFLLGKESRYADLLVISSETFCNNIGEEQPNEYMLEALRVAECPVMIVPESFSGFSQVAIAYNGGPECMKALKDFIHLFPWADSMPTGIVYFKKESSDFIPNLDLLKHYARLNFNNLSIEKLRFDSRKYLSQWLEGRKDPLVVSGSFGRSAFSNAFRSSFVDDLIHDHAVPVFIAHDI